MNSKERQIARDKLIEEVLIKVTAILDILEGDKDERKKGKKA